MYFKNYSTNYATLKEWSRQLNIVGKGNYLLYDTEAKTLHHWKSILNKQVGKNTFDLKSTTEDTLLEWKNKLNNIYNK